LGATLAGAIVARFGFFPALWAGALIVTAGNLTYAAMAGTHQDIRWLTVAISIDNLGNGMAGTAFIAYLSSLTNVAYSATQYALFGTLWSLPAKGISGLSGDIADAIGFRSFFLYTAVLTLPALLLLIAVARRTARDSARHTARHTTVPPAG
jgi:PAT family beta-lactamase induction signal transducer AmpG